MANISKLPLYGVLLTVGTMGHTHVQSFLEGNLKKRDNLEDLYVDGRVILK